MARDRMGDSPRDGDSSPVTLEPPLAGQEQATQLDHDLVAAEQRQRVQRQVFARLAIVEKEARASFVAAALWGAADNARLLDVKLEREIHRVMMQVLAFRSRLRDRLRALPRPALDDASKRGGDNPRP